MEYLGIIIIYLLKRHGKVKNETDCAHFSRDSVHYRVRSRQCVKQADCTKQGSLQYKSMLSVTVVPEQRDIPHVCCVQAVLTRITVGVNRIYLGSGAPAI